ncbi:N-acyl homoserine lactonase AttM [Paracoccus acridae]|uniref:N-acyl homoserine lactonase AttM n=1 Tax=Paracoccus acridae TaxID=1795310 RepID=A0ABQ1VMH5_9RHOB|nr:N-acyl homoserine lactonase family protein [Paracoccus acridae]GGF76447.1 N-acyl homoserine lactonase AttM [Paracoccus acridae]
MSDVKLYLFQTGTLKCKYHDIYLNQGEGRDFEIPVPFYVIDHPKGLVVVDGGTPEECAIDARGHWGPVVDFFEPVLTPGDGCVAQMERAGLDVSRVSHVVLSHLHLDHVGAVGRFPGAKHIVQRAEMHYARTPDWFQVLAYIRKDIDRPDVDWFLLDEAWGDFYDLFGDGSVTLIRSPGHTTGHQSVLVRTARQAVLLAVDAADTLDHWEERALPGALHSAVDAVRSVQKLRAVQRKTDALVIAGHDPEQWSTLKKAPDFY